MENERFFDRYTISRNPEGKPEEAGRAGAATIYKAVDDQSKQPVMLQLVPLATFDPTRRDEFEARAKAVCKVDHVNVARVFDAGVQHGYFAFVTQYLPGETAEGWIVAHGTMTPDAVLRIGMQVVRGTAAAAYHGLTHRAIQPSNIAILPGESPSGGWPFIKLLNLGIAALELHGESNEARELAPAMIPQFASPEQVRSQQIDFRSAMYSLGATMCFLLTGAVPLPSSDDGNTKRRGRRRLPELASMPKPVRRLLGSMLSENPEDRPLDPVALERYMVTILGEIERRQVWASKFGIPLATGVQRKIVRSRSPLAQMARGALAVAALLVALAAIGAILYPQYFHRAQSVGEIGVPVGVPMADMTNAGPPLSTASPAKVVSTEKSSAPVSTSQTQATAVVQAPSASPAQTAPGVPSSSTLANLSSSQQAAVPPNTSQTPIAPVQPSPMSPVPVAQNALPNNSTVAANTAKPISPSKAMTVDDSAAASTDQEPEPPSYGPEDEEAPPATSSKPAEKAQPKAATRSNTRRLARNEAPIHAPRTGRWTHGYFIGTTPGGKLLFRLPSGRIVARNPRYRRAPIAVRPRAYQYPSGYFAPPPYGYPPPDY